MVLLSRSFSSRRRRRRRLLRLHPSFLSFYFLLFLRQLSASFLVPSLWQRRQTVLHPTLLHVTPQLSLKRPRLFQPFLFLFPAHAFSLPRVFHHSLARLSYHPRDLPNTLFVRPQRLLAPFLRQPFLSYPFQILDQILPARLLPFRPVHDHRDERFHVVQTNLRALPAKNILPVLFRRAARALCKEWELHL